MATAAFCIYNDNVLRGALYVNNATREFTITLRVALTDTTANKTDMIDAVATTVPGNSTLAALRTALTASVVAAAATLGYTVPVGAVILPGVQAGA